MDRRHFIHASAIGLLATGLQLRWSRGQSPSSSGYPFLFFDPADVSRLRQNARSAVFAERVQELLAIDLTEEWAYVNGLEDKSVPLNRRLGRLQALFGRQALAQLIDPCPERAELLRQALLRVSEQPVWATFVDGRGRPVGIQRGPLVGTRMLFAREVLDDQLSEEDNTLILDAIANNACIPSERTLWGMHHPREATGWDFSPQADNVAGITLERWPIILDKTNLKAFPITVLGLFSLARPHDPRSEAWLKLAEVSAKEFLSLFKADGSYPEGIGYLDYALRYFLLFLEAHLNLKGNIDWVDQANFYGVAAYITTMQLGVAADGIDPDVVNFSDARNSVVAAVPLWIAKRTGSRLAGYAARQFSRSNLSFNDMLWYRHDLPAAPPPDALKNNRLDMDWIVCRTGWDPDDVILAFRSGGPENHEHADRNHFILKAYGERMLTDPFGASYHANDPGWLLRLTPAHNAVLIDGKGHQFHDGSEGTNASVAHASVERYVDRGEVVWWSSDATPAYQLVSPHITRVMRTVLFVKPNWVLVFDQIDASRPVAVEFRFFPDNRDESADIAVSLNRFTLSRPAARLRARVAALNSLKIEKQILDLPERDGVFPFVAVHSGTAAHHEVVTVLEAEPASLRETEKTIAIDSSDDRNGDWHLSTPAFSCRIESRGRIPELFLL